MRRLTRLLTLTTAVAASAAHAQPVGDLEQKAFEFERIHDDVYHAVGAGAMVVGSNSVVIINEADVLLVDSHTSPVAAQILLEQLREITSKPVRTVVNTHFHFDHLHGNQIYPADVEIIAHEFTREAVVSGASTSGRAYDTFVRAVPDQVAALEEKIAASEDEADRKKLRGQLEITLEFRRATEAVRPMPPTATLAKRMTLYRGEREIRLLFFGRGHTGGDVVVYLPKERILATGDLLTAGLPYMGDSFIPEWVETLEHLKTLEFDVALSGHGKAIRDTAKVDHLQAFFQDLWAKATAKHADGVPAEEAAKTIDMRSHAEHYPTIEQVGVHRHAVDRIYELLDESYPR